MNFLPLPEEKIIEAVDRLYKDNIRALSIILTDGTTLWGPIPCETYRAGVGLEPVSELCFARAGYFELYYDKPYKEKAVFIPLREIGGISPLSCTQLMGKRLTLRSIGRYLSRSRLFDDSALELMFRCLWKKAIRRGYPTKRYGPFMYTLPMEKPFRWEYINFLRDTPLYCDWDYLSKKNGGLNSLGVGFVASISAGWSKSLWSSFKKKVESTLVAYEHACSLQEVSLKGFPVFLTVRKSKSLSDITEEVLKMEGSKWYATIFSSEKVRNFKHLTNIEWIPIYFKEDSLMLPKDLWEKLSQPIRVFGDIVTAATKTQFGEVSCFVKARAAAFLSIDSE